MNVTRETWRRRAGAALLTVGLALAWPSVCPAQRGAVDGQWRTYGGGTGSTRYAALDQINRENVGDLEIAWRWKTDNFGPRLDYNLEVTPLVADGVMYVTAGSRRVVAAIDAETGETLWIRANSEGMRAGALARGGAGRGVAYWSEGDDKRVFAITRGYKLLGLNASTGLPIPSFGEAGVVDLAEGLGPISTGGITSTSPPLVANGVIVVGASMSPLATTPRETPAHIRGYDVKTGKQRWIFHVIPREGEPGIETWENDSWKYSGNAGTWTLMSADEELGYVYLPLEATTNDWYGGHRPGDNLYAESLVCLDIRTGELVWHFQTTHHGVFDYDLPAAPVLLDVNVAGRAIKAVAQPTKQGFLFVFDRVTGEPIWPIEERPVPQSDVPGEKTSLTQPFPTKPAPFDLQGVSLDDLLNFTPELKAEAVEIASLYRLGPLFTPGSLIDDEKTSGTIVVPGSRGGINWPGAAADPDTGMIYIPSSTVLNLIALKKPDPNRATAAYLRSGPMYIKGPQGLPLLKPPWGRITAIDLNTGEHAWMIPMGKTPTHIVEHPALEGIDLSQTGNAARGGPLVTKTLLFVGAGSGLYNFTQGAGGRYIRAYDKATGEILAEIDLPAEQTGVPMTYMLEDKQYIALAVGAKDHPGEIVALRLPTRRTAHP